MDNKKMIEWKCKYCNASHVFSNHKPQGAVCLDPVRRDNHLPHVWVPVRK